MRLDTGTVSACLLFSIKRDKLAYFAGASKFYALLRLPGYNLRREIPSVNYA